MNMFNYLKKPKKRKSNMYSEYEKKIQILPKMLKQFNLITKKKFLFESKEIQNEFEHVEHMFENDFVTLNCEIQSLKAENQSSLEEISVKQEVLGKMDRDLIEKEKLIKYFEGKINKSNK